MGVLVEILLTFNNVLAVFLKIAYLRNIQSGEMRVTIANKTLQHSVTIIASHTNYV